LASVTLEGWYRRGMTPFVELSRITGEQGESHRSYSRWIQMAAPVAVSTVLYLVCLDLNGRPVN
jgi:hypothetical protein